MQPISSRVERVLSWVRESLAKELPASSGTGPDRYISEALAACDTALSLFRPPSYEVYNPADFGRKVLADRPQENLTLKVEPAADCTGDTGLAGGCLRLLLDNAELAADSDVVVEVFEQDEAYGKEKIPCIGIGFDGLGRIPDVLDIGGFLSISFDELGARWTIATRGGRIDRMPNGLLLRLKGVRVIPEISQEFESIRLWVCDAQDDAPAQAAEIVDRALSALDGPDRPPESADVKTLFTEVLTEFQPLFEAHEITPTVLYASQLLPVVVRRNRLRAFFAGLCDYALAVTPSGKSLDVICGYDTDRRELGIVADIEGIGQGRAAALYSASFRRAIVDAHGGTLDWTTKGNVTSISVTLPDSIGRVLEEWIPGFEVFSDRSKQMLRLLKSAPAGLPEEALLAGVLEDELERWLLPRLSEPAAMNAAHEIPVETLPKGFSAERRKKVLEQIRKGKPKKEICKPPYAAEILHGFRNQERHRKAIGADRLSAGEIETLASNLTLSLPPFVDCLRCIVRARHGQ